MLRSVVTLSVVLMTALGCGRRKLFRETVSRIGEPCRTSDDCRVPLQCDVNNTCQPSHAVLEGELCGVSADCAPELYCGTGICAVAGNGPSGELCASTAQCQADLVCAFTGLGGTCTPGGTGDIGDHCSRTTDCRAALLCDPITDQCAVDFSAPAGTACTDDTTCAPDLGIVCAANPMDATSRLCTGRGPDGTPVPPWSGATCPSAPEPPFRVLFEVGYAGEDFFRLPFPNDIRMVDGTVDLEGFPRPPLYTVPADLMTRYVAAIEAEQQGFGPNQTVFMRTSMPPLFCKDGCGQSGNPACAEGCMGEGEPAKSLYVVDLSDGVFVAYYWQASTASLPYICGPWIALTPGFASPWRPGHVYAAFLHARIKGSGGQVMQQDADFAAMLAPTEPSEARLQDAWTAYQPLRDWLATSPPYPSGDALEGQTIFAAHLGGAAVFTPRDPTDVLDRLGTVIESISAYTVADLLDCADPSTSEACWNTAPEPFVEVQGTVELPIYQQGEAPYLTSGGGLAIDGNGDPMQQRSEAVRFSLTIPKQPATQPVDGWPVVLYAHGTGGSYQSHLGDGTAARFASASQSTGEPQPAVVLGIDQVAHGPRRGDSQLSPDLLFFNLQNPQAAKGNVLQSAADQLSLLGALDDIELAITGLTGRASFALDETRVAFFGHSQGSTSGVLAMARAASPGAVALSGAGGGLLTTLMTKTSPYDLPEVMRLVLADRTIGAAWAHPALSLIQGYMEEADPINYGRHLSAWPLAGSSSNSKHVLQVVGIDDTYTPNETAKNLASRMAPQYVSANYYLKPGYGIYVDDGGQACTEGSQCLTGRCSMQGTCVGFGTPTAYPPFQGNYTNGAGVLTAAVTVHAPANDRDGHFVVFDDATAGHRVEEFLADYLADPSSAPHVVE